jgi:hypothetical protein
LCERLAGEGFGVFVPEIKHGSGKTVDSTGALAPNSERFAKWVRRSVPGQPLLVGHSYGGLIARKAISTDGLRARGLFTIATPHDGSWIADTILDVSGMPCGIKGYLICRGIVKQAVTEVSEVSAELTRYARRADRMSPPNVPIWAYAGSGIMHNVAFLTDGYVAPNDPWVGVDSAWGQHANLGRRTECEGKASHNKQLAASHVIDAVVRAAGGASDAVCPGKQLGSAASAGGTAPAADAAARRRGARGRRKSKRRAPEVRITRIPIALQETPRRVPRSGRGRRGTAVPAGVLLAGPRPFTLVCGKQAVEAVRIARGAYALRVPDQRCRRPAVRAGRNAPVVASPRAGRVRANAVVRVRGRARSVTVQVRGADRGWLTVGSRRIAFAPTRGGRLTARVPRLRRPRVVRVRVERGGDVAQGTVTLMR